MASILAVHVTAGPRNDFGAVAQAGMRGIVSFDPSAIAEMKRYHPDTFSVWRPYTAYAIDDEVTYNSLLYRCRQAHTSLPGWEPPNVPALWLLI